MLDLARGQRMVLVGPVHHPVLDASDAQVRPPPRSGVGLVAIDRSFVAADQKIGRLGVVDIGRGHQLPADDGRALVSPTWTLYPK